MEPTQTSAIVPLAVLQAVRTIDQQGPERILQFNEDLVPKRLGMNPTVMAQIERYRALALRNDVVGLEEVVQLFRLVGRRADAGLAFSQGGRLAARHALHQMPAAVRIAHKIGPQRVRHRLGLSAATRLAAKVFGATMSFEGEDGVVVVAHPVTTEATPEGVGCSFYAAAMAELLRSLTNFDGAMLHDVCMARGDECCRWHTGYNQGE